MVKEYSNDRDSHLQQLIENPLLPELIDLLNNNKYIDTSRTEGGVYTGSGYLLSTEAGSYLSALSSIGPKDGSANDLLTLLKDTTNDIFPVKPTNKYEFSLLLKLWNDNRNEVQWDKIQLTEDRLEVGGLSIYKDNFLSKGDILSYADLLTEDEVYYELGSSGYGTKKIDAPYLKKSGAEKLFKQGINFLTTKDISEIENIFGGNLGIFNNLIMQTEPGRRIGKGPYQRLWTIGGKYIRVWNDEKQEMVDSVEENALPLIRVEKNNF